jgi:hypothetical protein
LKISKLIFNRFYGNQKVKTKNDCGKGTKQKMISIFAQSNKPQQDKIVYDKVSILFFAFHGFEFIDSEIIEIESLLKL